MGTDEGCGSTDKPVHAVRITKPFFIQTTEVTQTQWLAVMGSNPAIHKGDDLPVENVSWNDVQVFICRLNEREPGKHYRLPTEAEWEYACRAGTKEERYGSLDLIAWNINNAEGETHPVGTKQPNGWGLYDMLGNVWEWCQDEWHNNYLGAPDDDRAWEADTEGQRRVIRGGDVNNPRRSASAASRCPSIQNEPFITIGLRLIRENR